MTDKNDDGDALFNVAVGGLEEVMRDDPALAEFHEALTDDNKRTADFIELSPEERPTRFSIQGTLGSILDRLSRRSGRKTTSVTFAQDDYVGLDGGEESVTESLLFKRTHKIVKIGLYSTLTLAAASAVGAVIEHTSGDSTASAILRHSGIINSVGALYSYLKLKQLPKDIRAIHQEEKCEEDHSLFDRLKFAGKYVVLTGKLVLGIVAGGNATVVHRYINHLNLEKNQSFEHQLTDEEKEHVTSTNIVPLEYNTKLEIERYRGWAKNSLKEIDTKKVHAGIRKKEDLIREACEEESFNNPALISALVSHLYHIPVVPLRLMNEKDISIREVEGDLNTFKQIVKDGYINPLRNNLRETEKKYGTPHILEAIAGLIYSQQEITAARKTMEEKLEGLSEFEKMMRLMPIMAPSEIINNEKGEESYGYDSEEEVIFVSPFSRFLPQNDRGDTFFTTSPEQLYHIRSGTEITSNFISDVLKTYFAIIDYHQSLKNMREQNRNKVFGGIPSPPVVSSSGEQQFGSNLSLDRDEECNQRYSGDDTFRFYVGNPSNIVNPGTTVVVRFSPNDEGVQLIDGDILGGTSLYISETPKGTTRREIDRNIHLLNGRVYVSKSKIKDGDRIDIPIETPPGERYAILHASISDGCSVKSQARLTVTNKQIPDIPYIEVEAKF
jgi:hypothetical protein